MRRDDARSADTLPVRRQRSDGAAARSCIGANRASARKAAAHHALGGVHSVTAPSPLEAEMRPKLAKNQGSIRACRVTGWTAASYDSQRRLAVAQPGHVGCKEPKWRPVPHGRVVTVGAVLRLSTGAAMASTTRQLTSLIGISLLLLTACDDFARDARRDFGRLTAQSPFASSARPARSTTSTAGRQNVAVAADPKVSSLREPTIPERDETVVPRVNLVGQSEGDIRARFGAPTSEEDRAPGKTWRYRHGQCALDVSLYPDVQTRKFTTLAYEVRSDDNTDQGKQLCLGQLQSRGRSR
jgi:hypothetical protein